MVNKGQEQETLMPESFVFCYYYQYFKDVHFYAITSIIGSLGM